jgi:Zn-dependent protease with chaperone function
MKTFKLPIKEDREDNINPSNPNFLWLWKMIIISIPLFIVSYIVFYTFSYFIIWNISIEKEKELFSDILLTEENKTLFDINSHLTNKIKDLKYINIYLENNEEVNAYALIWWNIILTTWLLQNIDYEEELIFIIWHEMKHIENRDVLQALLTDVPFYLTLQIMWFDFAEQILDITSTYSSKTTEIEADNWWIQLVNDMNLNLDCSLNFFEKENSIFDNYLQLISSHPTNINRITNIKKQNINKNKKCNKFIYNN